VVALDFDLLPDFSIRPLFITLEPGVDEMLEREFPLAYARLESSTKFTWYIHSDSLHADEPKATRIREALLRASLAEYASADEALKRGKSGKSGTPSDLGEWPTWSYEYQGCVSRMGFQSKKSRTPTDS